MVEANRTKKRFVTCFIEEYEYYRSQGLCMIEAKRKALQYNKRFTKREVTAIRQDRCVTYTHEAIFRDALCGELEIECDLFRADGFLLGEGSWNDANISPEDRTSFNQLFSLLLEFCVEYEKKTGDSIGLKYISYIVNRTNVGQLLDDHLRKKIQAILDQSVFDNALRFTHDLAAFCGFALRDGSRAPNRFDRRLKRFRTDLCRYARQLS